MPDSRLQKGPCVAALHPKALDGGRAGGEQPEAINQFRNFTKNATKTKSYAHRRHKALGRAASMSRMRPGVMGVIGGSAHIDAWSPELDFTYLDQREFRLCTVRRDLFDSGLRCMRKVPYFFGSMCYCSRSIHNRQFPGRHNARASWPETSSTTMQSKSLGKADEL